ncbi:MAG: M4 family metallopeptidase [Bacteroidota bacterium]
MKKTIFAGILSVASLFLSAQVNSKLQAYVKETSYNKQKQLNFIKLNESPVVTENEVAGFINSMIFNGGTNKVAVQKVEKDDYGFTHTRYNILQNGIILYNKIIIAHCQNGKLLSLNGELRNFAAPANPFALSEKNALAAALKKIHAKKYKWENKAEEAHMREVLNKPDFTYYPTGIKTVLEKNGKLYNTYQFTIYAETPLYRANVFVDANTGKVLDEKTLICEINVPGSMATKYSGTQTVTIDQNGSVFRMRETVRGLGVETYNLNYTSSYTFNANSDFTNTTSSYTGINNNQGARDAHWGAEKTYDYFFNQHQRNSIDNSGFKLLSYVHYNTNYANAFWDGFRMTYGDGNNTSTTIFTALDVCGHEISHGLTENTAGLDYQDESGALNESYSDIFGACIENYARPTNWNWKVGEDLTTSGNGLRNMSAPNGYGDPDTYTGTNWYIGTADNGGVHTNSGVSNYWFYLLTTGGSGTNDLGNAYSVASIGMTSAARIAFRALTVYYTPFTDYPTARALSIQAAKDIFGNCSFEVEQTAKAWHAVGVGGPYSTNVVGPNFNSLITNFCALPATVMFNNTTANGQNYTWSFGDGATATTTNAVHTYTSSGTFNVKLKATGCGNALDSITMPSYVSINVPPSPVVTNGVGCGPGPVSLSASGTGNMTWFTSPFSPSPLSSGNTFITPNLSSNTTFYVANSIPNAPANGGMLNNSTGNGGYLATPAQWLVFNVIQNSNLVSVVAYANSAGPRTVELRNFSGVINSTTFNMSVGANTLILNYNLAPGNNYELGLSASSNSYLYRNTTGMVFPYNIAGCVSITGSSSGYYYFFYNWKVAKADCMSPAVPVVAAIVPPVVASLSTPQNVFCTGDAPVTLLGTPAGGTMSGLNVSGTAFNPLITGTNSVVYSYTDPNGCSDTSVVSMQVMACTGIHANAANSNLSIYPNPATDHLVINNETGDLNVNITDATGRLIFAKQVQRGEETIDLSTVAKGIYLVQVSDQLGKTVKTVKLVKE